MTQTPDEWMQHVHGMGIFIIFIRVLIISRVLFRRGPSTCTSKVYATYSMDHVSPSSW
jgi:hypothetical protein